MVDKFVLQGHCFVMFYFVVSFDVNKGPASLRILVNSRQLTVNGYRTAFFLYRVNLRLLSHKQVCFAKHHL